MLDPSTGGLHENSLEVECSCQSAQVDGVAIFVAGDEVFAQRQIRKTEPFVLNVAGDRAVQPEKGVSLTVYVTFVGADSNVTFDSVGVQAPQESGSSSEELQRLKDRVEELEKKMAGLEPPKLDPRLQGGMMTDADQARVGVSEHGVAGHVEAGIGRVTRQWDGAATRFNFQRKFERVPHVQITPDLRRDPQGMFQQFWLYFLSNGALIVDREGFNSHKSAIEKFLFTHTHKIATGLGVHNV
ncbi:hypothetical protein F5Y14DRAFT_453420 [Nemania sp. NC0429]|nr:hypothetical protein F5Y14DRAFT_453420 [Nemania sp. NC0429]